MLRDARVVDTVNIADVDKPELAKMMVGREVTLRVSARSCRRASRARGLGADGGRRRGPDADRRLGFEVRAGEVFGVAGVAGNGQTELVEALIGLRQPETGEIRLDGQALKKLIPARRSPTPAARSCPRTVTARASRSSSTCSTTS